MNRLARGSSSFILALCLGVGATSASEIRGTVFNLPSQANGFAPDPIRDSQVRIEIRDAANNVLVEGFSDMRTGGYAIPFNPPAQNLLVKVLYFRDGRNTQTLDNIVLINNAAQVLAIDTAVQRPQPVMYYYAPHPKHARHGLLRHRLRNH